MLTDRCPLGEDSRPHLSLDVVFVYQLALLHRH